MHDYGFVPHVLSSKLLLTYKLYSKTFLLLAEKTTATLLNGNTSESEYDNSSMIIKNLTAWWVNKTDDACLKNVNAEVKQTELLAVIGTVGSGKSSFIKAILNELPHMNGEISVHGRIAYSAQEPWVFNSSVKNNIVFGRQFDEKRYKEVISVTALEKDFSSFPYGDETIVGEKGVTLSGGQKARVSLAR